jgi:hypothetical protein
MDMTTKRLWTCMALTLAAHGACGTDTTAPHTDPVIGSQRGGAGGSAAGGVAGTAATLVPTLPTVACDSTVKSEISCGGSMCPAQPASAATTCTATCCTADGKCGTRSTATLNGQAVADYCIASAVADARCPSSSLGGTTLVGCCDALGRCGQLYGTTCLSAGTGPACDAPPSAADAGE